MAFSEPIFGASGVTERRRGRIIRSSIAAFAGVGLVALSVFSAGIPAQAAAGDDSIAESAYLSGSLLSGLLEGELALLGTTEASNNGTQALQTDTAGVDALVGLTATAGGIGVPIALANAGALSGFSQAASDGSSIAATGLVNASGDVGVDVVDVTDRPDGLSLNLANALSSGLADELTALSLEIGATSSRASQAAPAAAVGSYEIVGAELRLTSDTVAGVSATVDGLAGTLSGAVDAVAGPGGSLLGAVTNVAVDTLNTLPLGLVSAGDTSASVSVDFATPLAALYVPVTSGAVTVDFGTGEIVVDLAALKGGSLSGQPANTFVLTPAELAAVTASISTLVGQFANNVEAAVTAALEIAEVDITVDLGINLGSPVGVVSLARVSVDGTLAEIASSSPSTTTITALGTISIGILTSAVVDAVIAPLVADLLDPNTAALQTFVGALQTGVVTPVIAALTPALAALALVVKLSINNQELIGTSPNQQFVETALRLSLLEQGPVTKLLLLDVARSAVGPNHSGVRPVITDVDPTSGPASGGTSVTLTGTDFTGSNGVTFDGTAGTDFTVVSDTEITVTSPAHAAGLVDVIIQHPAGASDAGGFTFTPVPVISSLTPDFGPISGGTVVIIEGTDFTGATGVTFDGDDGTAFTVDSDTQITVTTPAHALGVVDAIIERATGNSVPADFTYRGAPTASGLTPNIGPVAGGTAVTITGIGFIGSTGVTFDGDAGTSLTVVSDTEITVSSPAHVAETIAVVVQHPIGDVSAGDFTYTSAPIISSLSPNVGSISGGTEVTITGSGFTGSTGVTFDGDAGSSFTFVSDTEITVSTPVHNEGAVEVIVLNSPANSAPGTFTYIAPPTVTDVAPTAGPVTGGTVVTIEGSNLTDTTRVTFDGDAGTSLTILSDTEITITTPAHVQGTVPITLQHPGGDLGAGLFEYLPIPVVASLTPATGPTVGGTVVTITGSDFTGVTGVTFDGDDGTSFIVVSDTEITVTTPAGAEGAAAVVVEHPNGNAAGGDFTYLAAPVITGIAPVAGPTSGGTSVTLTGTGFTGATGVTFAGDDGTSFTVVSDTEITVSSPAHAVGAVEVTVVHPGGASIPATFTYRADPTVTLVSPNAGPLAGGTEVTITGTGFTGATGVTFDGDDGTSFIVVSDTEITVTSPPHDAGSAEIVIQHPINDAAAGDFTYASEGIAVVSSMSPLVGPDTGGTLVTLRGSGFLGATGARFGDVWGTNFTVLNDTMATVVTPAHEAMWVPAVLSSGAEIVSTPGFTFELTTLAATDDGLAYTGSSGLPIAWVALALISAGALLMISRRRVGRHRA
ncbi:IPT/TIG domain-containing protein [Salinibacterium sp. M195]|uniref:IPT/TIG domain-containing protein n=1 Tax=Salinibacterium sp. M195 TaxID=2583374 RepID=UPI001C62EB28|nr:IPT/TIG domain-containing protein [Salinibacterium sp. M195]